MKSLCVRYAVMLAAQVMQLFTIGTMKLNAAGQFILDGQGSPIPNYNNEDAAGVHLE